MGRAVGDGQGGIVDEHGAAHAGGRFQGVDADFGIAGGVGGDTGNGNAAAVGRPGGPGVKSDGAGGLRQDAAHRTAGASGIGIVITRATAGICNGAGGDGIAVAAVGADGEQLALRVNVGDAVDGHRNRNGSSRGIGIGKAGAGRRGGGGQERHRQEEQRQ